MSWAADKTLSLQPDNEVFAMVPAPTGGEDANLELCFHLERSAVDDAVFFGEFVFLRLRLGNTVSDRLRWLQSAGELEWKSNTRRSEY